MKNRTAILCGIILSFQSFLSIAQKPFFETEERLFFAFDSKALAIKTIRLSTGVQLEYAEQGMPGNTPVIFLHGFTDSWHSYETVLTHLPSSVHAFALTQRGHGHSSKETSRFHPKDFADDVAAFMKAKHLDKAIIAGHSMGGVIAQQFVLDHPALVKGVILIGTDPAFGNNPGMPEFTQEILNLSDPVDYGFAEAFQYSTIATPMDSAVVRLYINETLKVPATIMKAILSELMKVDYAPDLHKIRQPVLVVWGDKDLICPRDGQDQFMKSIRHANLLVYEGIGHAVHWEEPKRFADDVVTFIATLK